MGLLARARAGKRFGAGSPCCLLLALALLLLPVMISPLQLLAVVLVLRAAGGGIGAACAPSPPPGPRKRSQGQTATAATSSACFSSFPLSLQAIAKPTSVVPCVRATATFYLPPRRTSERARQQRPPPHAFCHCHVAA